jgi:hypothetical protein
MFFNKNDSKNYVVHGIFRLMIHTYQRFATGILIQKNLKSTAPAIFCYHQHAGNFKLGESEVVGLFGDPHQALAVELAERGYINYHLGNSLLS